MIAIRRLGLVLLLAAVGCQSTETRDATQLVVQVQSDLAIGVQLTRLEVKVVDPQDGTVSSSAHFPLSTTPDASAGTFGLPLSFGVGKKDYEPVQIEVKGFGPVRSDGAVEAIIERTTRVGFRDGKALLLRLFLDERCLGAACGAGTTCYPALTSDSRGYTCDVIRESSELPVVVPGDELRDVTTTGGLASTGGTTGTGGTGPTGGAVSTGGVVSSGGVASTGGLSPVAGGIRSPIESGGTITAPATGGLSAPQDGGLPDASDAGPDGSVSFPDGSVSFPDGSVSFPDGSVGDAGIGCPAGYTCGTGNLCGAGGLLPPECTVQAECDAIFGSGASFCISNPLGVGPQTICARQCTPMP